MPINEQYVFSVPLRATIYSDSLHWYLAIIYEPEHVIRDPPVDIQKLRPRLPTRLFIAQAKSKRIGDCQDFLEPQMEDLDRGNEVERAK